VSSRQTARHIEKNVSQSRYERSVDEQWRSRRAQCTCVLAAVDALAEVLRHRLYSRLEAVRAIMTDCDSESTDSE